MENQFIRHEPCFERILFVLTLDRKKMKERILIGEEQQIRFRLNGSQNAEVLCDMTRPLGTFLINFERDTDRDWNLYGLSPLRQALHSNRWKQPELEQAASEFLWEKYLSNDPLKCMWRSVSGTAICLPENPVTVTLPVTASWIK